MVKKMGEVFSGSYMVVDDKCCVEQRGAGWGPQQHAAEVESFRKPLACTLLMARGVEQHLMLEMCHEGITSASQATHVQRRLQRCNPQAARKSLSGHAPSLHTATPWLCVFSCILM